VVEVIFLFKFRDRKMKMKQLIQKISSQEDLNFLLTNRIPRITLTRFVGWWSQIKNPLIRDFSIGIWKLFSDLDLSEAAKTKFDSMHDCFIRELKPGARTVDMRPNFLSSPCDAIVGECGAIDHTQVFQAKGFPYSLTSLMGFTPRTGELVESLKNGTYITLRLTSSMYHRFHAPHDLTVEEVIYHSGDTWNVNPIAVKRIERLFCLNERAVLRCRLAATGQTFALVPVAAVMVASIKLHFLNVLLNMGYRGPHRLICSAQALKGEEMGWFEHGSTIIVLTPPGFGFAEGIQSGATIRMGQALMTLPSA
jgi:phosphatidylserine decarboxylase